MKTIGPSLDIASLQRAYREGSLTPAQVVEQAIAAIGDDRHCAWIHRIDAGTLRAQARALQGRDPAGLPLFGIPFAIKNNIDLAGVPTTAGCPAYAYTPERSAAVVQRLLDAGAIALGKTNLDQFATGLNGTRSPYGACRNTFDPAYVSGGSSSGSAVAVALGHAGFSLGTDTAGSGRVPAGFNNLVGLKPSLGLLSTRGVVPACRSLDAVCIFALTAADAQRVFAVAQGFDPDDAYSRPAEPHGFDFGLAARPKIGVPRPEQLAFFGDATYARAFDAAVAHARALGVTIVEIDFEPFLQAARLLYEGPWVAERYQAIRGFIEAHHQFTSRGARLVSRTVTAPVYRLYALAGGPPLRPGLVRVAKGEGGAAIAVEVWELPASRFGSFVAGIPAPLGIGRTLLADGSSVPGFICEPAGVAGATDITGYGGWVAYLSGLGG